MAADSAEKAMVTFRALIHLADSLRDGESLGIAYNNIALIFSEWSVYDSAIFYHNKASRMFEVLKDTLRLVQSKINTGIAYKNLGDYESAFSLTIDAANGLENMIASAELASAYTTLGNTFKELRRPKESMGYHEKAFEIRTKLKDSAGIAGSLNNIGNVYKSIKQYRTALRYYEQSLKLKEIYGPKRSIVTTVDNIAETHLGLQQYKLAEQYELRALSLRNAADDKDGWMITANRLANLYLVRNKIDKARTLALEIDSVAREPIYLRHQLENALLLKDIYTAMGDHQQAVIHAATAIAIKDSLFSSDMSEAISKMNIRFNTEQQQKKLELVQKNVIIQNQQISNQRYIIALLGGIVLLLFVISYLLYNSSQLRKRSRERTELLMMELNHRVKNNLQMISAMLNLQIQTAANTREVEIIEAARGRIHSIGTVHNLLYQKQYNGYIEINMLIAKIVQHLARAFKSEARRVDEEVQVENIWLLTDQAIPLGLIVNEWLTNIYKYAKPAGAWLYVKLKMEQSKGKCFLHIIDNGQAWNVDEVRVTKKGLGLLLTDMLTQQLQGVSRIYRENNENNYHLSFRKA